MALWVRGKCIGNGSFGSVNLAVNNLDGSVFAVKSVEFDQSSNRLKSLENEIRILRSVSSPFIVKYLGDDLTASLRNLHLEYMPGGTLADVGPDVDEFTVKSYTFCLVSALRYLHGRGIVHCDVKGKNVLIGPSSGHCKLADFGSAIEFSDSTSRISPRGSPLWMAPEVIRGEYQGPESDVWSIGCTMIEMLTGGKPGWEELGVNSLSRIGFSNELPKFPAKLSELGCDFLEKCLRRDKSKRWSCERLLEHPFLSSVNTIFSTESSPRCVLDWVNSEFEEERFDELTSHDSEESARKRISKLATMSGVNWESDGWVTMRDYSNCTRVDNSRTEVEFSNITRTKLELSKSLSGSELDVIWYSCKVRSTLWCGGGGSSCRRRAAVVEKKTRMTFYLYNTQFHMRFNFLLWFVFYNCFKVLLSSLLLLLFRFRYILMSFCVLGSILTSILIQYN